VHIEVDDTEQGASSSSSSSSTSTGTTTVASTCTVRLHEDSTASEIVAAVVKKSNIVSLKPEELALWVDGGGSPQWLDAEERITKNGVVRAPICLRRRYVALLVRDSLDKKLPNRVTSVRLALTGTVRAALVQVALARNIEFADLHQYGLFLGQLAMDDERSVLSYRLRMRDIVELRRVPTFAQVSCRRCLLRDDDARCSRLRRRAPLRTCS
jgi:hypothetical protein